MFPPFIVPILTLCTSSPNSISNPSEFLICVLLYDFAGKCYANVGKVRSKMGSRGANVLISRANRMRQMLQSALEANVLEIEDVSYQHAGHAAVKGDPNETHFNLKIVSSKFEGQSLVKRHRMVYELLDQELKSGLHAVSIVAKTPKESGSANI